MMRRVARAWVGQAFRVLATVLVVPGLSAAQGTGVNLTATTFDVIRLAPGAPVATSTIVVSDASAVVFDALMGVGNVGVAITTPTGVRLTEASIESIGGSVERRSVTSGTAGPLLDPFSTPGHHIVISIPSPTPGTWVLEFTAPPGNPDEIAVAIAAIMNSPTVVALVPLPNVAVLGHAVSLTLAAFSGAQPIAGASVEVQVIAPDGVTSALTLLDDGATPDAVAGDGLYSGAFVPAAAGRFEALGLLSGATPDGVVVARQSAAVFDVVDPTLALLGSVTVDTVDANLNGQFEAVVVNVSVNVLVPGDFAVRVVLTASNGATVTRTTTVTLPTAGATTIPVTFTADHLRELGVGGPYRVGPVEVTYLGSTGAVPAATAADLGQTPAIALADLEQPSVAYAGVFTDAGVDLDENGLFDELRVHLDVAFAVSGTYSWSALLFDRSGRQIGTSIGSVVVPAGTSTLDLVFDGEGIGARGVNGPYTVGNLLVSGSGGSLVLLTVTNTSSFLASQFEGFVPPETVTTYFAEGATSDFFDTEIALLNVSGEEATVTLTFLLGDGTTKTHEMTIGGVARATISPRTLAALANAEFSTVVESTQPLVADRTMRWDARGYGSHAGTSIAAPALEWYLAEGATIGDFNLFYLIQNPTPTEARIDVTYLLPAPQTPIVKSYTIAANSRFNIWVNHEDPVLASAEVSAVVRVTNGVAVAVERAMYLTRSGRVFDAGHGSAAVTGPAVEWFLAEGATGAYFDLFVLIANPETTPAQVAVDYLLPDGAVLTRDYAVAPQSRFNIWVDLEDPLLADTALSARVRSTNGVPIIVERAMWWPGGAGTWHEGHNSAGATQAGTRWGLADGQVGGPFNVETYVLIANTSSEAGVATVTLVFEEGGTSAREVALPASSRTSVPIGVIFPEAAGRRFGVVVESIGTPGPAIVVERAMYSDAEGVRWAAGSNVVGTRLQ